MIGLLLTNGFWRVYARAQAHDIVNALHHPLHHGGPR